MRAGIPSRTAQGVAVRRAVHQEVDRPPIFVDPLASRIIGNDAASKVFDASGSRSLRAFVAARSRYAEDQLAAHFDAGVRQYVLLGAGLDTFAYRNPHAPDLRVFEVDHPDTQAWKMERVRDAGIPTPESLTYVPVDFERQRLADAFNTATEFDAERPAFFSWLGVTPYLTREALIQTLEWIASMPAGSGVVFDYAVPAESLSLAEKLGLKMLAQRVEKAGESFQTFLEPLELSQMLREIGFSGVEDLGQHEINSRYFENRTDGLRIGSSVGRLLRAKI